VRRRDEVIGILLAAVVAAGLWALVFWQPVPWMSLDLYPTWVASQLVAQGQPEAVYHPQLWIAGDAHPAWVAVMERFSIPQADGTSFTYSPLYLLVTWPLTRTLSLTQLSVVVFGLNALASGVVGNECLRLAGCTRVWLRRLGPAGVGLLFPVMAGVWLGQNTLLCLTAGLLGARLLAHRDRRRFGGLALWWLACALKPWFVLVLLLLLPARRWADAALAVGGWALLFLALPRLLLPELAQGYAVVSQNLLEITIAPPNNVSIRAHLMRIQWEGWAELVRVWTPVELSAAARSRELWIVLPLGALVGAWGFVRGRRWEHLVVVGLAAVLVPLGVVWTHYLVFALPLAVVLAFEQDQVRAIRWLGALALAYLLLMWPHALPNHIHDGRWDYIEELAALDPTLLAWRAFRPTAWLLGVLLLALGATVRPRTPA